MTTEQTRNSAVTGELTELRRQLAASEAALEAYIAIYATRVDGMMSHIVALEAKIQELQEAELVDRESGQTRSDPARANVTEPIFIPPA